MSPVRGTDEGGVGRVVDPTKNVLDLVQAAIQRQDDLRDAETRRVDDLAEMRVYYEGIVEGMRSNSLKLLAEQLRENKSDSSERTSKLEQFRWESGGKTAGTGTIGTIVLGLFVMLSSIASVTSLIVALSRAPS